MARRVVQRRRYTDTPSRAPGGGGHNILHPTTGCHLCGVPACLGLADLKAARRFTQGHGRLAELGEQDWCICREPAGELGKEGHELLVGGACSVAVWPVST